MDAALLSAIITVHVDEKDTVRTVLSAVQSFARLCSQRSSVGRIVLDIGEYCGSDVAPPALFNCRQRLRWSSSLAFVPAFDRVTALFSLS